MSSNLTIRNATPNDEASITALWQTCGLVTSYNDPTHDFRFAHGKINSDVLVGLLQTEALLGVLWLAMTAIVTGFITWQLTQIIANRELGAV